MWHVASLSWGMPLLSSNFNHPICKPGMSAAISCVPIAQLSSRCLKLQVPTGLRLADCSGKQSQRHWAQQSLEMQQ